MKKYILALIIILSPIFVSAKTLEYSAWIPYWKKTAAATEVKANLSRLKTISPFSYEVKADGTLTDAMKVGLTPWPDMAQRRPVARGRSFSDAHFLFLPKKPSILKIT